jgi:hypothetical protein
MASTFGKQMAKQEFSLISRLTPMDFLRTNSLHQKPNNVVYVK